VARRGVEAPATHTFPIGIGVHPGEDEIEDTASSDAEAEKMEYAGDAAEEILSRGQKTAVEVGRVT
jgi:hypothetical protein